MGFRFKQFEIDDTDCAQKVGTDAVLLGAWTNVDSASRILDVGAGCGIVSLMLAQRTSDKSSMITAVETERKAAVTCGLNFRQSPWAERLEVVESDFRAIQGQWDLIVSNPPFFLGDLPGNSIERALARQGGSLNYFSLIDFASERLIDSGRLVFVSDVRHAGEILFRACLRHLTLTRRCRFIGKEGDDVKRFVWEFTKYPETGTPNALVDDETVIHRNQNGGWHEDYVDLTRHFYLRLS